MTVAYTVRPISDRSWFRPASARERSRFTASWSDTLELLTRELNALDAKRVVLECDVSERDIRLDGQIRAGARPASDAVVVAFESRHGPLQYRSDLFNAPAWSARDQPVWQSNVRAVALTLQALRAVDRYAASSRGEQYRGYQQLTGTVAAAGMDVETAKRVLRAEAGVDQLGASGTLRDLVRLARAAAHPDRHNGDRSRSDAVDAAVQALQKAGQL